MQSAVVDIVIDTVVFVRSLINPRSLYGELIFRRRHQYRLIVSEPIVREILEVIQRPELTRKFSGLIAMQRVSIEQFLDGATLVEPVLLDWTGRDPKDDIFIATALAGNARYLVSEDRDLLDLDRYEGVTMIDTAGFLKLLVE